ncbi:MAG: LuxR C-terminal-related transcriptional regulator [Actinomycetes bacterium]
MNRALTAINLSWESILIKSHFRAIGLTVFEVKNFETFDSEAVLEFSPDVAVISLGFDRLSGVVLADKLRLLFPSIGLVFISDAPKVQMYGLVEKEMPFGSKVILKSSVTDIFVLQDALHSSVDAIANREKLSWVQNQTSTDLKAWESEFDSLSTIQLETYRLLANGLSNAEIARVRDVSEKSVEHIIGRIAVTMGIASGPKINQRVKLAREFFRVSGAPIN